MFGAWIWLEIMKFHFFNLVRSVEADRSVRLDCFFLLLFTARTEDLLTAADG
jgi:hypothetical protein